MPTTLTPFTPVQDRSTLARIVVSWSPDPTETAAHDKLDREISLAPFATNADIGRAIGSFTDAAARLGVGIIIKVLAELKDETAVAAGAREWAETSAPSREWGKEEVVPEGAARAAEDEAAAARFGLALPPAFFALGTTLVDIGVENAAASRAEFDAMPWATEALSDLAAEVKAEDRRDIVTGLSQVLMSATGRLIRKGAPGVEPFGVDVEADALRRLQSDMRAAIKAGGDLGIVTLAEMPHPELVRQAAQTWNNCATVLGQVERAEAERKTVVLRTRMSRRSKGRSVGAGARGTDERRQVFAVVSESYGEIDIDRIAQACMRLEGVRDLKAQVYYDRQRCTIDLLTHTNIAPDKQVVGDLFRVGLRCKTDDTGKGSLQVYATGYRVGCRNYTVVSCDGAKTIIRHLGDTDRLVARLNEALGLAGQAVRHFAKQWVSAARPLTAPEIEAAERAERKLFADLYARVERRDALAGQALMDGVFRSLLKELVPVRAVEEAVPALRAAYWDPRNESSVRENLSRAAISNGLTLWSQSQPLGVSHEVEVLAGQIVAGETPITWKAAPTQKSA